MKYFKTFFKHTWHPQQVEQPSRFEPRKMEMNSTGETELSEMKIVIPTVSVATPISLQSGDIPCRNGACKTSRIRSQPGRESPWHFSKTIFLITVIIALIIWVIVYTSLAQYQIL